MYKILEIHLNYRFKKITFKNIQILRLLIIWDVGCSIFCCWWNYSETILQNNVSFM